MRTQIAIIGAGPAGLMLAHLLRKDGIECVIIEARNRDYLENRVRAGVLEQGTVDLIHRLGLGERMMREGLVHTGVELGFHETRHRIDLSRLTGKEVTVYGQHEVVKDLLGAAEAAGIPILFNCADVSIHYLDQDTPCVRFRHDGMSHELHCDYIAGCDGYHGVCRPSIPASSLTTYENVYPFSWLGILAEAEPSQNELVYMNSDRGFTLFSMRSRAVTRLYLQCSNNEDLGKWSDDRIWNELLQRFQSHDGWAPNLGAILQKGITPMRSFVVERMQFGRLFLCGDAAHIVPPTGAKGMNLAISDVKVLAECLCAGLKHRDAAAIERYSEVCPRRVWRAQRFSWWMTSLLHNNSASSPLEHRRNLSELEYIIASRAASTTLTENYVGLPSEYIFSLLMLLRTCWNGRSRCNAAVCAGI